MNDTSASHPPPERLAAFHQGRLGASEAAAVKAHLAGCAFCRDLAEPGPDPSATAEALLPGETAGLPAPPAAPDVAAALADHPRYRITAVLGHGGMGTVYKAEHRLMERPVALKVIKKELTEDPAAVERFRREVKAAARLAHPNIVAAYDAEQAGDTHFLVMEYVEGTDLGHLVKEKGPLPVGEACDYVRQAALGLEHARERGLVHRDVKPQNLMLTPQGRVKILDFGLAQLASAAAGSLTGLGTLMGTPDYIAPEQARDAHTADIRADVYSLGCTLYHLLAGRPPFADGPALQRVVAHLERMPRPLAEARAGLPPGLVRVVERMMAKDPARRYQTPAEAADALAPFAGPAQAARPGPGRPRGGLRKWLAVALVLLAALGLTGSLLAPAALRYVAGHGELVLEAGDRDVEVTVRPGEGVAVVLPLARGTKRALALWPGDYQVEVREKDGPRSATRSVHLPRGGREVLALGPALERAAEDGPGVTESGGVFTFRNAHYEATIEGDGCVTSLRVGGVEFLAPGVDFSRGGYFFDDVANGVLALTAVERTAPDAIAARGDKVSARYEFGPDALAWTLTNATDHLLHFYVVFSTRVTAVRSGGGRWAKAPAEKDWADTTWFAGPARLTVTGGTRVWGPWIQDHQVWEAKLGPGETRRVALTVGATSEAEAARVAEVRRRPEPPEPPLREPPSRALVTSPAPLDGLRRWTLETRGLRAGVHAVAFGPGGRPLATAGWDGAIRLWQPDTGRLLRILVGHRSIVRTLAWSPDGETLASASWDGTMRLWQPATGRLLRTLRAHARAANDVAWSPDGKTLASCGEDRTVKLWDPATGRLVNTFAGHTDNVWAVAWRPDGKTLASGSHDRIVRLWEADTGRLIRSWEAGPRQASAADPDDMNTVYYLAWSPDGQTLAAGVGTRRVRLWRPDTGQLLHTLEPAGCVTWSPDGKTLATGSLDSGVRLWRAGSGELLRTLEGQQGHIYAVAWSPDGKTLATGSGEAGVRLWQADTGQPVRALPGDTGRTDRGDWSPDGRALACGVFGPSRVHFWSPWNGRLGGPLPEAFWAVWSPDGRALGSHCPDGRTRLFRADTQELQTVLRGPTPVTWELAWSPDGGTVATGGGDRTVRLWEAASGKLLRTLAGHTQTVDGLAWSPDGHLLASASRDATTRIWEVKTGRRLHTLVGPDSAARGPSLAWSPDGKTLAVGNVWGRLTLWDVATGALIDSSRKHVGRVSVAWSADGRTLLSASEDNNVRFWDARDGLLRRVVPAPAGFGTFSPDRRLLASPLANSIRVWEVDTGRLLGTLVLLEGSQALLVSPDGHYAGPPGVERQLLYVVETDRGQDLLAPEEFARKYGWKNDPDRVRFQVAAPAAPARQP